MKRPKMTKIGRLYNKPREELFIRNDVRLSISDNDLMIEDFYSSSNHPYAVFSYEGTLLETNQSDKEMFRRIFNKYIYKAVYSLKTFGVEV